MASFTNPLNNIKIASPCSADWEAMIGNNRQRYCGECQLNVYNLSGMSRREAEDLLMQSEGSVCVRYFRRADGTVLTKDCPVGWQAVRKRMSRYWTAAFSLVFGLFTGLGLNALFNFEYESAVMGAIPVEHRNPPPVSPAIKETEVMGAIPAPNFRDIQGKVSNFEQVKRDVLKKQKH